jgi:glycosyltransferase involved in cell wall biosynthesis
VKPFFSIMIATYNQPDYIVKGLESCLNQDYDNFEVVIGDDSTNDDNYNALLPFLTNPKVKYFRNKENIGRVKNYRKLLYEYAMGDWAMMLDGDDYYIDNNYLSQAANWISENENIVLVNAGHLLIDENNNTKTSLPIVNENIIQSGTEIFTNFLKIGQHSTCIYDRMLAMKLNFYNLNSMGTDTDGLMRLSLHGNVVYLKNIVVIWLIHTQNNTFKASEAIKQMHEMKFIDSIYNYAINFIGKAEAKKWKYKMYNAMSYHILSLAENSNSKFTLFRATLWASKFWKIMDTLKYMKRTLLK